MCISRTSQQIWATTPSEASLQPLLNTGRCKCWPLGSCLNLPGQPCSSLKVTLLCLFWEAALGTEDVILKCLENRL